ncbi:MAG: UDP-glucose 4-epimerase GalE [Firmicutes bacterium]|nr:UDP-glucose 4-epimerase GalE [Bacillota bacterium]
MKVLVTGGAGYIGSHVVRALKESGCSVTVYDNLVQGHAEAVSGCKLIQADIGDSVALSSVLKDHKPDLIMHFAAYIQVAESMVKPSEYYHNNVGKTLVLLGTMIKEGIRNIVFSSSAAVYGEPKKIPVDEGARCAPANVYGETKLMVENIMSAYEKAYGLNYVSLRYFNAAGAHPDGDIGKDHDPETQLIPLVLMTALGLRSCIHIFGSDYSTPDGTCIRDYVHVCDLASAHILTAQALMEGTGSHIYNLGSEQGYTVRQVIETSCRITGKKIPVMDAPRRPGDPAALVANSQKIKDELGWKPEFSDLESIISTAWKWHKHHPGGYRD